MFDILPSATNWALHAVMVAGTTLIGVGVYMAGAGVGSATVAFLYVFVALYTAHFFRPGVAGFTGGGSKPICKRSCGSISR